MSDGSGRAGWTFRPLAFTDLHRIHGWRNEPGVARWYGDHPTLGEIRMKYGRRIRRESPTRSLIAERDGVPVGHVQWYWTQDYPEYHGAVGAGDGWVGVDYFIGDRARRGRGLGAAMIRAFVEDVVAALAEATHAVASPSPDNAASVRVLEKAGFESRGIVQTADGEEHVMVLPL